MRNLFLEVIFFVGLISLVAYMIYEWVKSLYFLAFM